MAHLVACPCCSCRTLEKRGHFQTCQVCGWVDDGRDADRPGATRSGPNGPLSLYRARRNFADFGACDERLVPFVRLPRPEELPDAGR